MQEKYKKYKWHKLGEADDFVVAEGIIMPIVAFEKQICITQHRGNYYAFQPKCPHAGASFEQGHITEDNCLVCPLHRFTFDIRNGRNVSGEGFHLVTYPIEVRESGVWVGVPMQIW
jgi:nitrite reductase/ring-hydroxylating ferredoxin subunit